MLSKDTDQQLQPLIDKSSPVLAEQAKFQSIYGKLEYLFEKVWVNCMK